MTLLGLPPALVRWPECGHLVPCEGGGRRALACVDAEALCAECGHVTDRQRWTPEGSPGLRLFSLNVADHARRDTLACSLAGCADPEGA